MTVRPRQRRTGLHPAVPSLTADGAGTEAGVNVERSEAQAATFDDAGAGGRTLDGTGYPSSVLGQGDGATDALMRPIYVEPKEAAGIEAPADRCELSLSHWRGGG